MLAVLAITIAAISASLILRQTQKGTAATACNEQGAVDTPEIVDTGQYSFFVQGWAADAAGLDRVELWANEKFLTSVRPGIARADVAAALPQCKFPVNSGYAFTFARGIIPPHATALEVRGVNGNGKAFTIGRLPIDLTKPFGMLDTVGPIEADGLNLINGWAIAEQGPVKVRVLAGDTEVLALSSGSPRNDVAQVFPAWPQAATSGFNGLLQMSKLPRGNYPPENSVRGQQGTQQRNSRAAGRQRPSVRQGAGAASQDDAARHNRTARLACR